MSPITHVAAIVNGKVYALPRPLRHGHIFQAMHHAKIAKRDKDGKYLHDLQGFLDSDGAFLSRKEALDRVIAIGQPLLNKERVATDGTVYSEDLWQTPGNWDAEQGTPDHTAYWEVHNPQALVNALICKDYVLPSPPYSAALFRYDLYTHTHYYIPSGKIAGKRFNKLYSLVHTDDLLNNKSKLENPDDYDEIIAERVFELLTHGVADPVNPNVETISD